MNHFSVTTLRNKYDQLNVVRVHKVSHINCNNMLDYFIDSHDWQKESLMDLKFDKMHDICHPVSEATSRYDPFTL